MTDDKIDYTIYYSAWHTATPQHAEGQAKWFATRFRELLPEDHSASILDVGCGMGFAILGMQQLGYTNVIGIDLDAGQVAAGKSLGLPLVHTASPEEFLRDHPATFETVLLQDVLEHVPVGLQISFLRSIRTALKPGGKVIVQVPNANSLLACRWRYNDYTHHSSFTEHSLRFVLLNAGFSEFEVLPDEERTEGSCRLWSTHGWAALRRRLVRFLYRQIIEAELGRTKEASEIRLDLNLRATARNPA